MLAWDRRNQPGLHVFAHMCHLKEASVFFFFQYINFDAYF